MLRHPPRVREQAARLPCVSAIEQEVEILRSLRRSFALAGLIVVTGVGVATLFGLGVIGGAGASSTTVGGIGLYSLGGALSNVANPNAYLVVVAGSAEYNELASLPGTSLAYFSGTDVNTQWSTGVPYSEAAANGWPSPDGSGNLLVIQGYPSNYVGNVGSSAYQQACGSPTSSPTSAPTLASRACSSTTSSTT